MAAGQGTYIQYVERKFTKESMERLRQANMIIDEYESQGYVLTLRQLYYQFVSRDLIPNTQASYSNLGSLISDGRLAGLVSWTALEDRGRNLKGVRTWDHPADIIKSAKASYAIDMWANQKFRPEVWVEKESLIDVLGRVCTRERVDFFATKGYNSQSEQWKAGRRLAGYVQQGQIPIIFHLGDHDPSGLDMTRDNQERLSMFAGVNVIVQRLALNMDQIHQYEPPPNPAKMSDSRAEDYVRQFGCSSWELDALEPTVIGRIIKTALDGVRDERAWAEMAEQEADDMRMLDAMIEEMGGKPDSDEDEDDD